MSEPSATTSQTPVDKIPPEVIAKLQNFDNALTALENALEGHLKESYESHLERDPTEMARIDLMSLFTVDSLAWSLLALRGQDPRKNEALQADLDRTKEYVNRLKVEEERRKQAGLNERVAKAVVRNALFDSQEYAARKKKTTRK